MTMTDSKIDPMDRADARAREMLHELDEGTPITALHIGNGPTGVAELVVYNRETDIAHSIVKCLRHVAIYEELGIAAMPPQSAEPASTKARRLERTQESVDLLVSESISELAVYVSDELAERVVGLLPRDVVANERLEVEAMRRPAAMEARAFADGYRCDLTGEQYPGGTAIVLAPSSDRSHLADDLGRDLVFSPAALRAVLEEVGR